MGFVVVTAFTVALLGGLLAVFRWAEVAVTVALTGIRRQIVRVDAFVGPGLAGNPAAVVLADERAAGGATGDRHRPRPAGDRLPRPHGDAWSLRWHGPRRSSPSAGTARSPAAGVLLARAAVAARRDALLRDASRHCSSARADGDRVELDLPALPPSSSTPLPTGLRGRRSASSRAPSCAASSTRSSSSSRRQPTSPRRARTSRQLAALPLRGAAADGPRRRPRAPTSRRASGLPGRRHRRGHRRPRSRSTVPGVADRVGWARDVEDADELRARRARGLRARGGLARAAPVPRTTARYVLGAPVAIAG